jgi:hypothetical protein
LKIEWQEQDGQKCILEHTTDQDDMEAGIVWLMFCSEDGTFQIKDSVAYDIIFGFLWRWMNTKEWSLLYVDGKMWVVADIFDKEIARGPNPLTTLWNVWEKENINVQY